MKAALMVAMLLLAGVCLVAASKHHQEPMVTLKRAYGPPPPNHEWRVVFAVPQSKLWMGIVLRDSISGRTEAYLVEWPACVTQRAE